MDPEIDILLIDDDEAELRAVHEVLIRTGMPIRVREARSGEEALEAIAARVPDVVLLDPHLPDRTGPELTRQIRQRSHSLLPIVTLASRGDEALAVELMKAGTNDYLSKQDLSPEHLAQGLRHALAMFRAEERAERAQHALRENRQWLAASLRSIGEGVITTNAEGRITYLNPVAEELTGWTQGEASGRSLREILGLDDGVVDRILGLLAGDRTGDVDKQVHRATLTTRDGNRIPVDGTATPLRGDDGDGARGVVVAVRDVSAQREADEAIRKYAVRLQELTRAGLDIISSPADRVLQVVTDRARELIGCQIAVTSFSQSGWRQAIHAISVAEERFRQDVERTTPVDSDIYALVCEENRAIRLTARELEDHPAWESFLRCLPHRRGWLAVPLRNPDGRNLGMIQLSDPFEGEFDDQDQEILLQLSQLASVGISNARLFAETQEAVRARDYVLAVVSHDLRNPLSAIVTNAHLLQRTIEEDRARGWAEAIERSSARMKDLIDDLLQASRFAFGESMPLEPERLDVRDLCQEILDTHRGACEARGSRLRSTIQPPALTLEADGKRLLQVLNNLVGNAVEVSPAGSEIHLRAAATDEKVSFVVEDQGPGFDPDDVEHLFAPFHQSGSVKTGATGLGLAIAKGIIRSHGGRIWAENRASGGARFAFEIPAHQTDPAPGGAT
jgi:PAS domain S-box-containing protein